MTDLEVQMQEKFAVLRALDRRQRTMWMFDGLKIIGSYELIGDESLRLARAKAAQELLAVARAREGRL